MATFASTGVNVARAAGEVQTTPPFFAIPLVVSSALQSQSLIGDPWGCSVSEAIADEVGLGAQVRVCRDADHCAVYTVTEIRKDDPADMLRLSKAGRERLGTSKSGYAATLRQALATESISEGQAKSAGEFVERVCDDGKHQGLLVMAPHGGAIEINTDRQARRVRDLLSGADVSTWCCNGYKPGGGAWDRWHVTSTAIDPISFPGLAQMTQREYAYSVSFHGMSASGILIGGGGPQELKQQIAEELSAVLGKSAGPIKVAKKGHSLGGSAAANVTNWVTAGGEGGIQIEQSYQTRSKHWQDVAEAVANVFAGLI